MSWLTAFLLTQALEVPIFLVGMRGGPLPWPWRLAAALGASGLTHPIVWFVLPGLDPLIGYWGYFAVAESFAFFAEWAWLRAFEVERPGWWSLLANGFSATTGLVVHALSGTLMV